jgi:hypothetical protein
MDVNVSIAYNLSQAWRLLREKADGYLCDRSQGRAVYLERRDGSNMPWLSCNLLSSSKMSTTLFNEVSTSSPRTDINCIAVN